MDDRGGNVPPAVPLLNICTGETMFSPNLSFLPKILRQAKVHIILLLVVSQPLEINLFISNPGGRTTLNFLGYVRMRVRKILKEISGLS